MSGITTCSREPSGSIASTNGVDRSTPATRRLAASARPGRAPRRRSSIVVVSSLRPRRATNTRPGSLIQISSTVGVVEVASAAGRTRPPRRTRAGPRAARSHAAAAAVPTERCARRSRATTSSTSARTAAGSATGSSPRRRTSSRTSVLDRARLRLQPNLAHPWMTARRPTATRRRRTLHGSGTPLEGVRAVHLRTCPQQDKPHRLRLHLAERRERALGSDPRRRFARWSRGGSGDCEALDHYGAEGEVELGDLVGSGRCEYVHGLGHRVRVERAVRVARRRRAHPEAERLGRRRERPR